MLSPDQLLDGRKYRDVDLLGFTNTTLAAKVDGKTVEVDLDAKPGLNAEVQAIAPGASRLRIAQASLESVRADELKTGQTEAWLVVADPTFEAPAPRSFFQPASLLSATRYASGLTADEIAQWPNLTALITHATGDGGQSSSRNGAGVNAFQMHHSTMLSWGAYVSLVQGGGRQVSSNLAIDGDNIVRLVNLNRRAWTSGSASFDAAAITVETANSTLAPNYLVSEASKRSLGRVAAAIKADRKLQALTKYNVYLHKQMREYWGVSYSTACAMDITSEDIRRRAGDERPTEPAAFGALSDAEQARLLALLEATRDGQLTAGGKWTYDQEALNTLRQVAGKLDAAGRKLA